MFMHHVTRKNVLCYTCEGVVSYKWMGHVVHVNELRHTYESLEASLTLFEIDWCLCVWERERVCACVRVCVFACVRESECRSTILIVGTHTCCRECCFLSYTQ